MKTVLQSSLKTNMFKINEIAEAFHVNPNVLRFYEKKKLLIPKRDNNGYRLYSMEDMLQFQTILLYRKMGFSIEDILKMLADEDKPIKMFFKQYDQLNHHIHNMRMISEALEECIDLMFKEEEYLDQLVSVMKKTAGYISQLENWEDKWEFDNWAKDYDEYIRTQHHGLDFYKHYDKVIRLTTDKVNEVQGNAFEVGVGTGNLAGKLMETQNIIGIDQSVNMLIEAKKKFPDLNLRMGTFLELPLQDGTMDTAVSCYAFHHCNESEKRMALTEMDRVLKPGGRIIITDLMFYDKAARENFERYCTEAELRDLKNEYFTTVTAMEDYAQSLGYSVLSEQIDDLIWILVLKRKDANNSFENKVKEYKEKL